MVMIDSVCGDIIAEPMACTIRAPMSCCGLCARPQPMDAAVNTPSPIRYIRFGENKSPKRAPTMVNAVSTRM